ncbi:hypothetical protein J8J14_09345 [Roseomonas sp. SSH11]|uniref:Capsule polysaccharide biosynthesis protein n=1 Tax=Pararoseomonas baculiformis TaxID=2820812 RepID=A0ABS4ADB0_9PROT|nr:hypothetical protein [Pararoseomonas baculiformis]MBP0444987.1 hypothetical protein [Pararoseomonas baculiformis]
MPLTDEATLSIPEGAALEAAFWKGRTDFLPIVRKMGRETWRVADPMPAIRLLQSACRPVWTMSHRVEAPEQRVLRDGLLPVLAAANAPLLLHSPHEPLDGFLPGAHLIRLMWHGSVKATGRWNYAQAALPHMLIFDRLGYAGWSSLAQLERREVLAVDQSTADAFHTGTILPFLAEGRSKYRQENGLAVEGEGFVFVPLQLPNDSVIALKSFDSPYLEGMHRMVVALAAAGIPVMLKRHPHCTDPAVARLIDVLVAAWPGLVAVSRASIHLLIRRARAVMTLNSGVGFEALLHGKPVIAAGKAEYQVAATAMAEPEAAPAALAEAEARHDPGFIRRYLFLALNQHQIDTRDPVSFQRAALRVLCQDYTERVPR